MDKALNGSQRSEMATKRTWDFIEKTLEEDQKRKKKKQDGDPTWSPQTRGGTQQPDQTSTAVGSGTGHLHQVPDLGQPQSAGAGSSHVEANAEGQALGTDPHATEGVRQGRKNRLVHFQVPVPDQQEGAGAGSGSGEASDEQMPKRHRRDGGASSSSKQNIDMVHDDDTHELDETMEAWDDVKNESIDAELVRQARAEELAFMKKERVYKKVPIEQCHMTKGGSPTSVRWIDTNKGTKDKPNVRCRLVARDFKV